VPNVLKYLAGILLSDALPSAFRPSIEWVSDPEGKHLVFSYRIMADRSGVLCVVEQSTDLQEWFAADASTAETTPHGDGSVTHRIRSATFPTGSPLFMRLTMEIPWTRQFISLTADSERIAPGDSLINFMPVVLGKRLPKEILGPMVRSLMQPGRFLTDWSLATESVRSPFYNAEGYWRGPIWAPSTLLVWSGLHDAGYSAEAATVRERFLALCAKAGFSENFHAT
jgi:glycogen debranching enzyme